MKNLANSGQFGTPFGLNWLILTNLGSCLARICQFWPVGEAFWPTLANFGESGRSTASRRPQRPASRTAVANNLPYQKNPDHLVTKNCFAFSDRPVWWSERGPHDTYNYFSFIL